MRAAYVVVASIAASAPRAALATPEDEPVFPIAISVAKKDGAPARDDDWIATQIREADAFFGPLGVHFRWTLRKEIAEEHAEIHVRADRDALAAHVEKNVIDVFVVARLEDIDEPGRYRKGVAWTSKPTGKRFIILSGEAFPTVLTHELGHFFGIGHTDVPDNLMSYVRTGGTVFVDDAQVERIQMFSKRFLATGRLPDVGPPRRFF
ncbi:MAG: hypothetical protein KF819_05570 [Labilithrix sp.]|nr:hypothetical protein [Labilithrix sp.]